jgi:predicted amidohydrolase
VARNIVIGGAQMGGINRADSRESVLGRLLELMREAHSRGCDIVVFPELALTTFFPRWFMEERDEIDAYFEAEMPNKAIQPLFDAARTLGIGFYLGYAELDQSAGHSQYFNSSILVDKTGTIVGKYRKIHLPGHEEFMPDIPCQHLEKRYFQPGDLGFQTWKAFDSTIGMCICNDRRWVETYRVLALRGAEIILVGYNTPAHVPQQPRYDHLGQFHNHLVMQAGAHQNACWVVGVAKAGSEDGFDLLGGSAIISPTGEIVAQAISTEDELITARCDLDEAAFSKSWLFNFERHRRPEEYRLISEIAGPIDDQ